MFWTHPKAERAHFSKLSHLGTGSVQMPKKTKRAGGSEACKADVFVTDGGKNIFCLVEAFVVEKGAGLLWSISFRLSIAGVSFQSSITGLFFSLSMRELEDELAEKNGSTQVVKAVIEVRVAAGCDVAIGKMLAIVAV